MPPVGREEDGRRAAFCNALVSTSQTRASLLASRTKMDDCIFSIPRDLVNACRSSRSFLLSWAKRAVGCLTTRQAPWWKSRPTEVSWIWASNRCCPSVNGAAVSPSLPAASGSSSRFSPPTSFSIACNPIHSPGAVLILCNSGALSTWADLLNRWGYFRHVRLQNPNVGEILDNIRQTAYEVVLCTHGNYVKHHRHLLLTPWLLVVCDDAAKLRAAKGKFYLAAKQLPCPRRIAVASDAFDLDINSLWHVMEWINPGRFGDALVFRSRYTDPIEQGRKLEASAHSACLANERAQELLQLLKPVALRRYAPCCGLKVGPPAEMRLEALRMGASLRSPFSLFFGSFFLDHLLLPSTADAVYSQLPQKTERAVFCPVRGVRGGCASSVTRRYGKTEHPVNLCS